MNIPIRILRRKIPTPHQNLHNTHRTPYPHPPQPITRASTRSPLPTLPNTVISGRWEMGQFSSKPCRFFIKPCHYDPCEGQSEPAQGPDFPIPKKMVSPMVTGVRGDIPGIIRQVIKPGGEKAIRFLPIFRQESHGVRVFLLWNFSRRLMESVRKTFTPWCACLPVSAIISAISAGVRETSGKIRNKFRYSGILTPHIAQCRHFAGAYRSGSGESHPQNRSSGEP